MSIYPQITNDTNAIIQSTTQTSQLPMFKEYAWDFINNDFLLTNGKNTIVEGLDALKVWIYKSLQTQRYRYLAYSWNYGHEFEDLIGQGLSPEALTSEIERSIKETLMVNPYITSITGLNISVNDNLTNASFTVNTIYGEAMISV